MISDEAISNIMNKQELIKLYNLPFEDLIFKANKIKKEKIKYKFELCTIMNAKSGGCKENCAFCAQSLHHKTHIKTTPLASKDSMLKAASIARDNGAKRFSPVTSGNKLSKDEINIIAETISEIKTKIGLDVCASLGVLDKTSLELLKAAGMTRYHHNIETSRNYYKKIVTTHDYEERVSMIKLVRSVGLEICCGAILGLGESVEDRIDMLIDLKNLDVDVIPLNVLVPIKGTPLESIEEISCIDVIRTIALARILMPDKGIKIAAGRESKLKDFQALAYFAGANGMLIGGYLTINGRSIAEDKKLLKEVSDF